MTLGVKNFMLIYWRVFHKMITSPDLRLLDASNQYNLFICGMLAYLAGKAILATLKCLKWQLFPL